MDWFYVNDDRKIGPVSEREIEELVRGGSITGETKVWNEKISKWTPYCEINPGVVSEMPAYHQPESSHNDQFRSAEQQNIVQESTCIECGRVHPLDEMVQHGEFNVCASCKDTFFHKVKEGVSTGYMEYAGFWIRFAAKIIDNLIMQVVNFVVFFVAGFMMTPLASMQSANPSPEEILGFLTNPAFIISLTFMFILPIFYTTYFVGRFAATPGKMACGLKVVTEDGEQVSYMRAFGRFFAEIISGMILYIGYLMAAFDYEKRSLHDRICSTRVIKK